MPSPKFVTSLLIASCLLSVQALSLSDRVELSAAIAAQKPKAGLRYTPPKLPARGGLRSTQGAGSRGGEPINSVQVKLLAPSNHIGQTTMGHPTFFWYVSGASEFPVQFALLERGETQPIFVKRMVIKQAGITKLEIPQDLPELKLGKEYRWSVSIVQFPNRVSLNPIFQSLITRVDLTSDQVKQLRSVKSNRDRAALYADAGIWYDALAAIATDYLNQPADLALRQDLVTLLNQIGLPQVLESNP